VAADINRALEVLPEQWRTTVLLAEVEGLTWEEVAEVMGCPLGTVQSRIFRARRVLRQLLKDYAPEGQGEA
jgi:RNA polymerase sigma-70 factor (ECF subfamily)